MLLKNLVLIFTVFIVAISATSYNAITAHRFEQQETADGKYPLKVFRSRDKSVCWYTNHKFFKGHEPCCCLLNGKSTFRWSEKEVGMKWNHCITVKKGANAYSTRAFFNWEDDGVTLSYDCRNQSVKLAKKLTNVRSNCDNSGCLTQYGWFYNKDITGILNC